MSRSFYVDSLIVKEPSSLSKPVSVASISSGVHVTALSPTKASTPSSLPALHPVPCYPRHQNDFLNLCCPLCIPAAQTVQLFADRSVKQILPTTTTNPINFTTTSAASVETPLKHRLFHSEARSHSIQSEDKLQPSRQEPSNCRSPSAITDQRRIRYGNIGKE